MNNTTLVSDLRSINVRQFRLVSTYCVINRTNNVMNIDIVMYDY